MQPMQGSTWRGCAAGVLFGALALCGVAAADTICVPDDYDTIQEAIDAAMNGDEICVAPGTYNETIDFIGKAVRLYSTDGPEATVIDATEFGRVSVVTCDSFEGPETVLEGFTITGGWDGSGMRNVESSPTVTNCTFSGNLAMNGGGMYNEGGSPTVTNCTFSRNEAENGEGGGGGGMYNSGSSPTVTNCTFSENTAWDGYGGGMYNFLNSSPTVTNCTFNGNGATGGFGGHGGGMYNSLNSNPTVMNCTFIENGAWYLGGGMYNWESSPVVTNCIFSAHWANSGGGMWNADSSPTVTNCTFTANTVGHAGGGMYNSGSNPTVTNCTFSGNSAELGGGGMYVRSYSGNTSGPRVTNCTFIANVAENGRAIAFDSEGQEYPSAVTVTNCILWNGGDEVWNNDGSTIVISYSDIQGGHEGVGNIDADPLCDADGRPQAGSPCIDAGANNAVPADLLDLDNDGDTIERVPIDLDGNHRFMDDGATEDTGCGPIVVDMGAFEFPGEPVHPVLIGDIDLDGVVGFDDLVQILSFWGDCDPECCLADVDFTWEVDFDDLLIVLDNWS